MIEQSDAATRGTVFIAGATGFVGERLREAVRDEGYRVRLLVRSREDAERYQSEGFEATLGNILDPQSLFVGLKEVDAVINLVAIIKESGDVTFERINYQATTHLVDAARQASVERFVQMSALDAANTPEYPYHYTKWRAENYVKDRMPHWTIFRPSIIFGPSSDRHVQFVSQLADLIRGPSPVIPVAGDGRARFQPVHTDDVATAFAKAIGDEDSYGQTYELGGPHVLTYREILDEIARTLDVGKPKINIPIPLIRLGVKVMKPLPFIDPPVTEEQLAMLQIENFSEKSATPALIGREPRPFIGELGFLRDYYA